jgi:alkyl sulfatase BDS1-like metallo-beta-lactamase superfamily hydrolase
VRYVESLGGAENVVAKAREYVNSGDLRFAARMLRHAVCADPGSGVAKELLAWVYDRLGRGADDGAWREFFRTSARELRGDTTLTPAAALSLEQIFDTVAIRVDAQAACEETILVDWMVEGAPYRTTLCHGVLIHHPVGENAVSADLTLRLTKDNLLGVLAGQGFDDITFDGDLEALKRLLGHLDSPFVPVA